MSTGDYIYCLRRINFMIKVIKLKQLAFLTCHSFRGYHRHMRLGSSEVSSYETWECRSHVYVTNFSVISSNDLNQLFKMLRLKDIQEQLFSLIQSYLGFHRKRKENIPPQTDKVHQ